MGGGGAAVMRKGWSRGAVQGNNAARLSDNRAGIRRAILNNGQTSRIDWGMKHILLLTLAAVVMAVSAGAADAACYADYKAKRDDPLKLHYGVIQLNGACDKAAARGEIAQRLKAGGWVLLNVLSVFDESGLQSRKGSAGGFFLRF